MGPSDPVDNRFRQFLVILEFHCTESVRKDGQRLSCKRNIVPLLLLLLVVLKQLLDHVNAFAFEGMLCRLAFWWQHKLHTSPVQRAQPLFPSLWGFHAH